MSTLLSPSADELITEIRGLLNQPEAENSFWTDDELMSYISNAITRYFTELVQHGGGQYDVAVSLDITADQETVALPSDFFQVKALYRKVQEGYEILSYKENLTQGYLVGQSGGSGYLPSYYFRKNNLVLRPGPAFSETGGLLLEYVSFPAVIQSGGDSLSAEVSPVFRELIVMYAEYKAKLKESLVTGTVTYGPAKENLSDLYVAFKEAMDRRSKNPTFVQAFHPEDY